MNALAQIGNPQSAIRNPMTPTTDRLFPFCSRCSRPDARPAGSEAQPVVPKGTRPMTHRLTTPHSTPPWPARLAAVPARKAYGTALLTGIGIGLLATLAYGIWTFI